MRDNSRIQPLLSELQQVWEQNPDLRLGQLIIIATRPTNPCPELFYIEDNALLEGLQKYRDSRHEQTEPSNSELK